MILQIIFSVVLPEDASHIRQILGFGERSGAVHRASDGHLIFEGGGGTVGG